MHADRHAHILETNHAWQLQLVEAFGICPYARRCRLEGKLERQVIDGTGDPWREAVVAAMVQLATRADPPEVALLICPDADAPSPMFERAVHQVATVAAKRAGPLPFHVVAFHPDLPFDPATPQGLVAFWRRTPHPTIQLVHAPTLQQLRGAPVPRYVDPEDAQAVAALLGQPMPLDLADRISQVNWLLWNDKKQEILAAVAPFAPPPHAVAEVADAV